jgi:ketosteroid isomerase-like protein
VGEAENRAVIDRLYERVWISEEHDFSVMDASFAADAVLEYPQSGERIRGAANIRAAEEDYAQLPGVTVRRTLVAGDLAVVEATLDYQGEPYDEVSIFEFRDGLIVRHTSYFAQPFEPSERRARWVEQI